MPFSTYLPERMGAIKLAPAGPFVAGSSGVEYALLAEWARLKSGIEVRT